MSLDSRRPLPATSTTTENVIFRGYYISVSKNQTVSYLLRKKPFSARRISPPRHNSRDKEKAVEVRRFFRFVLKPSKVPYSAGNALYFRNAQKIIYRYVVVFGYFAQSFQRRLTRTQFVTGIRLLLYVQDLRQLPLRHMVLGAEFFESFCKNIHIDLLPFVTKNFTLL